MVVTAVSGQPIGTIFNGQTVQAEKSVTTTLRCVTTQKSEDVIYTPAKVWNHATE
jgi:hypothetical protein